MCQYVLKSLPINSNIQKWGDDLYFPIPSCGETISFKESVVEYKKKYKDYFPYLSILQEHPAGVFQGDRIERFNKQISSTEKEETQFNFTELLLVFFQSVSIKKKSIPLPVSAPFHCSLMKKASP